MDSLSQLVLGASVGVTVMGRRTAVWKAALWGGVAGTLPDLDVLVSHGDPLADMVGHRAETHALFWLTLFSPALATLAWSLTGRSEFRRWWLAMWLALITHPLLDACTVYGTRLWLPFSDAAVGTGSMFIIDPLYTLPLLAGLVLALLRAHRAARFVCAGLALSTAYLGWSLIAQAAVRDVALQSLPEGVPASEVRVLVTPAPFNTVLWRVVLQHGEHDYEGFRSLLDAAPRMHFRRFEAGRALAAQLPRDNPAWRLEAFARGFVRFDEAGGAVRITDLRMGQEPHYVFRFSVAERTPDGRLSAVLPRADGARGDVGAGLRWLWQRMRGRDIPPPA